MSRQMKDSGIPWLKEIPCHWNVERGKNVLLLHKRPVRESDEVITCFRDGEVILRSERRTEGFTMSDKEIGYQGINKGDIVIHGMDGFAGAMGVSKSTGKGSPVLIVCSPKYDAIPEYLVYYLRSLAMTNVFIALATGIRERSCDLRWNKISELEFILPPSEEQQRIADFLDCRCGEIDEMVSLQEQIIEELKAHKQAVITEATTHGLNPNAPMKPSGIEWIGKIPDNWEIRRLKSMGCLYGGLSGKAGDDFNVDEERDQFAYYVPFTNIWNNIVVNPQILHKVKVKDNEKQNEVIKGDVLFLMSSEDYDGVGKSSLVNCEIKPLYLNSFCKGFRITDSSVYPSFLNYLLLSKPVRNLIMVMANGFIRINLRAEKLGTLTLCLPPLSEQQEIADYLDKKCSEIDAMIAIKEEKIEELKDYKKSIIYEYITGKKEL